MSGIERIAAERQRQIEQEGWTPEHDDEHDAGELVLAAIAYADDLTVGGQECGDEVPVIWPWEPEGWRPVDPIRNLEKAGALIAAEIDRLERAVPADPEEDGDE